MKSRTKIIAVGIALIGLGVPVAEASAPRLSAQVFANAKGLVENVRWNRDGTTMTVTYDLTSSDPNAVFQVNLKVSIDGSPFKAVTLTGDIGERVSPGKGKKIVWQSGRDTENQDYDLFKFDVLAIVTILKPVDPPGPGKPVVPGTSDLRGYWRGTYAGSSYAQLVIDRQEGDMFAGTLFVAMSRSDTPTELSVEGTIAARLIAIRELKVVKPGKQSRWNLGSGSGSLQLDSQQMVGIGKDSRGKSYDWSFNRQSNNAVAPVASAPSPSLSQAPALSNLSGDWQGTYSGFPAELTLTATGPASTFTGTLRVTTSRGKAPTELAVEFFQEGDRISLREVTLVSKGAASSWNLGSGIGTLQPDNRQMGGSGRDTKSSYTWSFTKK